MSEERWEYLSKVMCKECQRPASEHARLCCGYGTPGRPLTPDCICKLETEDILIDALKDAQSAFAARTAELENVKANLDYVRGSIDILLKSIEKEIMSNSQLAAERDALKRKLAAMTAKRDALRAELSDVYGESPT